VISKGIEPTISMMAKSVKLTVSSSFKDIPIGVFICRKNSACYPEKAMEANQQNNMFGLKAPEIDTPRTIEFLAILFLTGCGK
jgi:hypothetical protein